MQSKHNIFSDRRAALIGCTALASVFALSTSAFAADTPQAPAATTPDNAPSLAEIVVTAQKRTQNQQDVPISITAVTAKALETNRVISVIDLNTVVPNMAVRPSAGGAMLPAFTLRGITSYGVVPGSDKEVSVYIDGIYISAPVGSSLDLPELAQIEVLRGPQGTLFGRNATVGAISVITRDPPSKFGIDQEFTVGNYHQFRSKTRVDFGSFGDFSATASYVHDQRRGDIENTGAGTTFTYPSSSGYPSTLVSPKYLGDKNLNSVFTALKYEHDGIKITNKFDWTGNHYTPTGAAVAGIDSSALGPFGGFLDTLVNTQAKPVVFDTTGKRPDSVDNSFTTPGYARQWGDTLIAEYKASSNLSFKNTLGFRSYYVRAANQIDGLGGLIFNQQTVVPYATFAATSTPGFFNNSPAVQQAIIGGYAGALQPLVGSPFEALAIQQITQSYQWSDEAQANYNSQLLTLTVGAMWFFDKGTGGGPYGLPNNIALSAIPFGNFAYLGAAPARAHYHETSLAAYTQAEVHVASNVDLVGGFRLTNDKREGFYDTGSIITYTPYDKTKPSYSLGVNYKPSRDVLLYAKYSTAFVAGGTSGTAVYAPENAYSWEAGIKSDWFDHRLRFNLSAFDVKYTNVQTSQSGVNVGQPGIALVVADLYDERAKGFELEANAAPVRGLTLGTGIGYTDVKFLRLIPQVIPVTEDGVPITLDNFLPTLQPKWTVNLSGRYETPPVIGDAKVTFQINASWRDKERVDGDAVYAEKPQYASLTYAPATWLVNARIALENFKLPIGTGQIAVWAKNLTQDRSITFPDVLGGFVGGTEFQAARTFGLDVKFTY